MFVVNVHFMDRDSVGEGTKTYEIQQAKTRQGETWGKRESVGENVREKNGNIWLVFAKKYVPLHSFYITRTQWMIKKKI